MKTIKELIEDYDSGKITPVEAFRLITEYKSMLDEFKESVYDDALDQAREFNKGEKYYGAVWEIRTGRTTYDFSQDKEYSSLDAALKIRKKELTDAAKMAASNKHVFDSDGVQIDAPPVKSVARDILVIKNQ
jgi:hypothetical protein